MTSKHYFEKVAPAWDNMREGFFSEKVRQKALHLAQVRPGLLSADIGAGTGFMTEALLAEGVKVIAIDESPAMLQELNNKFGKNPLFQCKAGESENLPVDNNSLDYIFANMYLHHVEHPGAAIQHAVDKLKHGGILVITDLDTHTYDILRTEHHDRWMGFEREDIKKWYENAGLKHIKVDCINESCNTHSPCGDGKISINIFYAIGYKK